jgi:hypothetical protein
MPTTAYAHAGSSGILCLEAEMLESWKQKTGGVCGPLRLKSPIAIWRDHLSFRNVRLP